MLQKNIKVQGNILICPSLDYRHVYPSKTEFLNGFLLDKQIRKWFSFHYLNNEEEKENPLVSINLSEQLNHLPATLIISAYFDPLRDEAKVFYEKLISNNVTAKLWEFDTIHGFLNFRIKPYCEKADEVIKKFIECSG